MWCALVLLIVSEGTADPERVAQSQNFVVRTHSVAAHPVARRCEAELSRLHERWRGATPPVVWKPRCEVIVHGSVESYQQAVGSRGARTSGSSRVQKRRDGTVYRRIDLFGGQGRAALSALSHELTHLVFADCFSERRSPAWIEEGAAVLADHADKRRRHNRDLLYAIESDTLIPLQRLLSHKSSYQGWQRAVFYGQSASLVRFLMNRGDTKQFIKFVEWSVTKGYESALAEVYGIKDVREFERLWLSSLTNEGEHASPAGAVH